MLRKILKWGGAVVLVIALLAGSFAGVQAMAFDSSLEKVYDVPPPNLTRSADAVVIARGKHLAESIGGCTACHGRDLSGGDPVDMGPVGLLVGPNITPAGRLGQYSDGELARLIQHGIKRDGHSVRFMPVEDFNWLPDEDILALVSYLRTVTPVQKADAEMHIGLLGKVLDRLEKFPLDVARHIDHAHHEEVPAPAPTASYGQHVAQLCVGCHGKQLSGGPLPGAPPGMAVPANITPDASGIKLYSFADFCHLLDTGIKRNGKKLDALMPVQAIGQLNDTERQALWAFLQSVPPRPFGQR